MLPPQVPKSSEKKKIKIKLIFFRPYKTCPIVLPVYLMADALPCTGYSLSPMVLLTSTDPNPSTYLSERPVPPFRFRAVCRISWLNRFYSSFVDLISRLYCLAYNCRRVLFAHCSSDHLCLPAHPYSYRPRVSCVSLPCDPTHVSAVSRYKAACRSLPSNASLPRQPTNPAPCRSLSCGHSSSDPLCCPGHSPFGNFNSAYHSVRPCFSPVR